VPLHLELAKVYDDAQKSEKTIEYCSRALRIDSENSLAYALLGSAYTRRSQWDKAVSSLSKALTLDPASEYAYELLGRLVLEAVLNVPSHALQAALNDPVTRVHYGPIVIRPELRVGIEYYQKGCTEKWQYLRVYYRMGMLYYHADKPEALQDRIRAAAKSGYGPAQEWMQELDASPQ
jgi:tetratricopeptide (TPR) repeat protein